MNAYRKRVWSSLLEMIKLPEPYTRVMDFGSGDGWFAKQVLDAGLTRDLTPIDVKRRDQVWIEPQIYSGGALPFPDRAFDLVYSVDVLHHCADPFAQLNELIRCSGRYLLLKDHTYETVLGKYTLAVMDELGNRRFGIPSVYQYQRGMAWHFHLLEAGFIRSKFVHPLKCHVGILGGLTNSLQFVALYERC